MKKLFLLFILVFPLFANSQCVNTTIWNASGWSSGAPNSTTNAIISSNYETANEGSIDCCSLTINSGSTLIIDLGEYCNVYGNITVDSGSNLIVRSGASLIPVSNSCISTGTISVERRTTSMKRFDYTYWSSPVTTTVGNALIPTKWEPNRTFTFNTTNFYDIETTYMGNFISNLPDGQDDNGDAWTRTLLTDYMIAGKGYASMIKSVTPVGTYPRTELVTFTGELNTGNINIPLSLSQNTAELNDDFNLIGNPYSSSINSDDVIDSNIDSITGTLYFWTHTNTLSASYSGLAQFNFSTNDYAKYTKLGGITAIFGGKRPSNVIGSCQGFVVEAEEAGTQLSFFPHMMSKAYVNTTSVSFFRNDNDNEESTLWLNMSNGSDLFSQQLIGYNRYTNKKYNKGWDSKIKAPRQILKFYSIEKDINYDIQARGKFKEEDKVKIGYFSAIDSEYTISIDTKEGGIADRDIYLYDKSLDVWHDLSEPYTFNTIAGTFDTRFSIRYENEEDDEDDEDDHDKIPNRINAIDVYTMQGIKLKTLDCWCFDDLPKNQIFILKIHSDSRTRTIKYTK
jgi:hypothetical protein